MTRRTHDNAVILIQATPMTTLTLPHAFNPSRRTLLKVGAAGAAVLTLAACGARGFEGFVGKLPKPMAGYQALRTGDAACLSAIIPILLAGALPSDYNQRSNGVKRLQPRIDKCVS